MKKLLLLLLLSNSFCALEAQEKLDTKKLTKIKKELNAFQISDALNNIQQLVSKNPTSTYYTELQVITMRQLMRKIKYAQEEYSSLVKQNTNKDSLQNADIDSTEIENNSVDKEEIIPAETTKKISTDSSEVDNNPIAESKKEKRKKKRKIELYNEKINEPKTEVSIDSTIIKKYKNKGEENADDIENNFSLATKKDKNNNISKSPEIDKWQETIAMLQAMPYDNYKDNLINNARKSTLQIEYADSASAYLHEFLVDTLATKQKDSVKAYAEIADEFLSNGDYAKAIAVYKNMLAIDTNNFSTYLQIGKIYDEIGKDTLAWLYYDSATAANKLCGEALFCKATSFLKKGFFVEAAAIIADAILIYPEKKYMQLLKNCVNKDAKEYQSQWIPREVYPINMGNNMENIIADKTSTWYYYQAAKQEVSAFANEKGILKPNEFTTEKYIELYCFNRMLDSTKSPMFSFAKAIKKAKYLDCYVFVSLFHQDIYPQYAVFAKENAKRIKAYLYMLINWEMDKYKKFRQ